MMGGIVARNM